MARKSQYSLNRKVGVFAFSPDLADWTQACKIAAFDVQIFKYFSISRECFYSFIDKERYKVEQGQGSAFLDAYINGRKNTKNEIANAFLDKIKDKDTGSILFGMKAYNGVIEQRDIEHIELKKKQLALKSNEFLTQLAEKFSLNKEELKMYADKYFKDVNMESI